MSTFPTSRPAYTGFTPGHTLLVDTHASQHNLEQADISALSDKVGLGASTPVANQVLTGNGTGTSSWSQVNLTTMVSGVLPVANGGTGTTSTTGSGSVVFATSPTISGANLTNSPTLSTPTITDFTNSQHNHSNAAGGGQIANSGISGVGAEKLRNPYMFSVYRNAAQNTTAAPGFTLVLCDTKVFDTSANVDIVTNKGRFTAPIAGFYQFECRASAGSPSQLIACLYKNGTIYRRGVHVKFSADTAGSVCMEVIQLAANDYVEFYLYADNNVAMELGTGVSPSFSGFLVGII